MRFCAIAAIAVFGAALSGCARDVVVMSAPNLNVYSSYTSKVPGKWALLVDGTSLQSIVRPDALACAAYSWPTNLAEPFRQSVAGTFRNLVEDVDLLAAPIPLQTLSEEGYAGLIRVNGDNFRVHLTMAQGFMTDIAEVSSEIDAGIIVETARGRVLGTQATGSGHGESDGLVCDGIGRAVESGSEASMRSVVGELAERFSNSPQIRALGEAKP